MGIAEFLLERYSLSSLISLLVLTNERARKSSLCRRANSISSLSFAVRHLILNDESGRFTPFLELTLPPSITLLKILSPSMLIISSLIKDRKSTRLNSSHVRISYAVFCLKKKKIHQSLHHYDLARVLLSEISQHTL